MYFYCVRLDLKLYVKFLPPVVVRSIVLPSRDSYTRLRALAYPHKTQASPLPLLKKCSFIVIKPRPNLLASTIFLCVATSGLPALTRIKARQS